MAEQPIAPSAARHHGAMGRLRGTALPRWSRKRSAPLASPPDATLADGRVHGRPRGQDHGPLCDVWRLPGKRAAQLAAICAILLAVPVSALADALASAIYVRNDSDSTLVVSPRVRAGKRLDTTTLDITYAVDVWTSASIDIRTAATPVVTEQRDEFDVAAVHELGDLTLNASYRYSQENDYASHGGSLGGSLELANKSATLDLSASFFRDAVGKSGEPNFSQNLTTAGSRLSFTQIIDPDTLAQLTYEIGFLDGYQASAYRVVGFGGTGYGCAGAQQCLPEHVPEGRFRNGVAALARRALGADLSAQANYRFYFDDWGVSSHTIAAQLDWFIADETLVTLRYRFYVQSAADFYQRIYAMPVPAQYWTRDRELSPLNDHRIGLDVDQRVELDKSGLTLVMTGGVGGTFYSYDDFVGLDSVSAVEVTAALGLEHE